MILLEEQLGRLVAKRDLDAVEAASAFEALLESTDHFLLTSMLEAWARKGVTGIELSACARVMRRNAFRVNAKPCDLADIVGTGGSRSKLFNVSTAAAFVAAGAGVFVAKHGNKAATSKSGSADVLTSLGVRVTADPGLAAGILNEIGICFMFAPKFHNLKPELAAARKSIPHPTIFNLLGPLSNPAGAPFQLTGVYDKGLLEPMANAVADLGTKKTWIVHAENGLDEIASNGTTRVAEIEGGDVRYFEISPSDFGVESVQIAPSSGLTPETSAETVRLVLDGSAPDSPETAIVLLNAAAAIFISGHAKNLPEAADKARESIATGAAKTKLLDLAMRTNL